MKIKEVDTVLLTGPCTLDPYLSEARKLRSAAFIKIEIEDGAVGIGETYDGYFFPESIPVIVDFFKPVLIGADARDIKTLWQRMYHCGNFWCRVGLGAIALTSIEAALWDLKGKAEGQPHTGKSLLAKMQPSMERQLYCGKQRWWRYLRQCTTVNNRHSYYTLYGNRRNERR